MAYLSFWKTLKGYGLHSINRSPSDYGLSLILGGAEVKLDELTRAYARLATSLEPTENVEQPCEAWSSFYTLESLEELKRPAGRNLFKAFRPSRYIAWKTGTSFGHNGRLGSRNHA